MYVKTVENNNSPFQPSNLAKFAKSVMALGFGGAILVGAGLGVTLTGFAAASPVLALAGIGSLIAGKLAFAAMPLPVMLFGYRLIRDSGKPSDKDLENGEFVLHGKRSDVAKVRKLDKKIIGLTRSYNKAAQVPEKTVAKIDKLVKSYADAASRVTMGYVTEVRDGFFSWKKKEEPVRNLEYRTEYPNGVGNSRQTVARIKLAS